MKQNNKWLAVLLLCLGCVTASAQLQLNLVLQPPYSPYFSDYLTMGNKGLLTITKVSGANRDIYFRASITGDNGISGVTKPDYFPPLPITISRPVTVLHGMDFEEYFNFSHFIVSGIPVDRLVRGAGLPEGNYTVCLQAFDFNSKRPLSNITCFTIHIVYPEAPIPTFPQCESNVAANPAQNFTFTWAPSPGAPPNTRYILKMTELLSGQNPTDALYSITAPPFFEKEVPTTVYVYKLADPTLTEGKTYAWQVTAYDPLHQTTFRNNGISPACTFTYTAHKFGFQEQHLLDILSPQCSVLGQGSITAGPSQDLLINWIWNFQKNGDAINKDAFTMNVDSVMGKTITGYKVAFIHVETNAANTVKQVGSGKGYIGNATSVPIPQKNASRTEVYSLLVPANRYFAPLSYNQLIDAGLVFGQYYEIAVSAMSGATVINSPNTCPLKLVQSGSKAPDSIKVKGSLSYRLEDQGPVYPVALTSVSIRFTNDATVNNASIKQSAALVAGNYRIPKADGGYEPTQPTQPFPSSTYISTTTDSIGSYSLAIPVDQNTINFKYASLVVNNSYYKQLSGPIPVDLVAVPNDSTKKDDSTKKNNPSTLPAEVHFSHPTVTPNFHQNISPDDKLKQGAAIEPPRLKTSIDLGQRIVDAYTYTLRVTMKKEFYDYGYDTASKGYTTKKNSPDLGLNAKAKIPDGIPVQLYRYSKPEIIPWQEGDNKIFPQQNTDNSHRLIVATGVTSTEPGSQNTVVIFKRLLCNQEEDNDIYYIQAILPTKQNKVNAQLKLSSPSVSTVFKNKNGITPASYNTNSSPGTYDSPTNNFVFQDSAALAEENSMVAPETQVSFKIPPIKSYLYQSYPSRYTDSITYSLISTVPPHSHISGKIVYYWPSSPGVQRPLANMPFTVNLRYLINDSLGWPKQCKAGELELLGAASLDPNNSDNKAYENSERELYAGTTDNLGNFSIDFVNVDTMGLLSSAATIDKGCITDDHGKNNTDNSGQKDGGKQQALDFLQYVTGQGGQSAVGNTADLQVITDKGLGFQGTGDPINSSRNTMLSKEKIAVAGAKNNILGSQSGSNTGSQYIQQATHSSGPSANEAGPAPVDDGIVTIRRVLVINIENKYYGLAQYKGDVNEPNGSFFVQTFENKDLGVLQSPVIEDKGHSLSIKATQSHGIFSYTGPINNAKMVLYRTTGIPYLPLGEGTSNHPLKPLLSTSVTALSQTIPVEWIRDTGYSVQPAADASGGYEFSFKPSDQLLASSNGYGLQVSPDPSKNGSRFSQAWPDFSANTVTVDFLQGKIVGRVTDRNKGTAIGYPTIRIYHKLESVLLVTDDQGYFEYENGSTVGNNSITWSEDGTDSVIIYGYKEGYKEEIPSILAPAFGNQSYADIRLSPGSSVNFVVVDEDSNAIDAYVQRYSDSTIFPPDNNNTGIMILPVPTLPPQSIRIIPVDPAYFDSTFVVPTLLPGDNNLGQIVMKRRHHRMRFHLVDANNNPMITPDNFRITINNDSALQSINQSPGFVEFNFPNVSVNNYSIFVEDIKGTGYIPQIINIQNPESRNPIDYQIVLQKGKTLSGVVNLDGVPTSKARVYLDYDGTNTNIAISSLQAHTDASGHYHMEGIPGGLSGITVHAVYDDKDITVNGDQTSIDLVSNPSTANFNLHKIGDFSSDNLWGFPMSIEKIAQSGNLFNITGTIDISSNKGQFEALSGNARLHFTDIPFTKDTVLAPMQSHGSTPGKSHGSTPGVSAGQTQANLIEQISLIPNNESINFTESAIKMKYQNRYNVQLNCQNYSPVIIHINGTSSTSSIPLSGNFVIHKPEQGGGTIDAVASIVDNSYNYPSSYLDFGQTGNFYLAIKKDGALSNLIPAIPAISQKKWTPWLTNSSGNPLQFSFIGFSATAAPANSFINTDGKINLDVSFKGTPPQGQVDSINIHLPKLVLDQNSLYPVSGGAPILAKLDGWQLEVKDWTVDPQKGGIYSTNSVIHTGIVDLQMGIFNLRHDLFVLDGFKANTIKIGAIELTGVSPNASLVYDQKTGSDLGAHWRFNLVGPSEGKPAANVNLEKGNDNKRLDIDYMQLISYNNENILTLHKTDQPLDVAHGNNKISFIPNSITSNGSDFFVEGNAEFKVPGIPTVHLKVKYRADGSGNLVGSLEPLAGFQFDAPGYVVFSADGSAPDISLAGYMKLKGTVVEPGKFEAIPCTFGFGNGDPGSIQLPDASQNYGIKLPGENKLILGTRYRGDQLINGMEVKNNDWTTLRFSGLLQDSKKVLDPKSTIPIDFEVLGDITATSNSLQVSGIATPFGALSMVFDYPSRTMHGSLHVDGIKINSYSFTGDANVSFGENGFIIEADGQLNTGTLLVDGFGTFSTGFLIGSVANLDDGTIASVNKFNLDPNAGCWLKNNRNPFQGFYMTGGYDIINSQNGFDIGVASVYLNAILGIEVSLGMNLGAPNSKPQLYLDLGALGEVDAGMSAITGTTIDGRVIATLTAEGHADLDPAKPNTSVDGSANLHVSGHFHQSLLVTDINVDFDKDAGASFWYHSNAGGAGCNFYLHSASDTGCK